MTLVGTANAAPVIDMAVGGEHECTVNDCGSVQCWGGYNQFFGEDDDMPGSFDDVAVGTDHTCGLEHYDDDQPELGGDVTCWGREPGDFGDREDWNLLEVPPGDYTQIDAGPFLTCGVKANDQIECWGWNTGDAVTETPNNYYAQVSAGYGYACGVTSGRSAVFCWGDVPAGLEEVYIRDVQRYADEKWTKVSAGIHHVCALSERSNLVGGTIGQVYCWGSNAAEQVTPPHPNHPEFPVATAIEIESQQGEGMAEVWRHPWDAVSDVSAGTTATCINHYDNGGWRIECWGYPFTPYGLGLTTWGNPSHRPPLPGGFTPSRVFLAFHQLCATDDSTGDAECWSLDFPNDLGVVDPDAYVCL